MNTPKTQVSKAVGDIVRLSNSKKPIDSDAATPRQIALFERGEELGYSSAAEASEWVAALKDLKDNAERRMLRAGFVSAYKAATGKTEKDAQNAFDYLARKHSPTTSRKKGAGRKEKAAAGSAEKLSEKDVAARLTRILHYVAKAQTTHAGDSEMLDVLGAIAALAGGETEV